MNHTTNPGVICRCDDCEVARIRRFVREIKRPSTARDIAQGRGKKARA